MNFNANLCVHAPTVGKVPCSKFLNGSGTVLISKVVVCTVEQLKSDAAKIELAMHAIQHFLDEHGISAQCVTSSVDAGGNVHFEADLLVVHVFGAILETNVSMKQEILDLKADLTGRNSIEALSVVSSSINKFCELVLLHPLNIAQHERGEFYTKLETEAATRDAAGKLLSASDVDISVDQILHLRNEVCKPRNIVQHSIAEPDDFEVALCDLHLSGLSSADYVLLTRMHESLWL